MDRWGRSRRSLRIAVIAAVVAMGAAACSSNGAEDELRAELEAAGLDSQTIECVVDAFGAGLEGGSIDSASVPDEATAECVGRAFEEMLGNAFDEAFSDLEAVDWESTDADAPKRDDMPALVESCRNGDNAACDDLWLVSPIGSPEEALAESCGGRSQEPRMGSCEFWLDG